MAKIGLMREEGVGEEIRNILYSFAFLSLSPLDLLYQCPDLLKIISDMLEMI